MTGRSRPGPAASRMPRPISRGCCRRPPGSMPSRPSSMARSWPSTRTGARTSRCSRRSSASRGSAASSTSRSTCSISMAGSCSTSRSRIASGCSRACSRPTRGSASRRMSSARARRSSRRRAPISSRASSPSCGAAGTSPGRRSKAWLKLKVRPEQELVIAGWTPGEGNARDLGALAVGYYEDGKLKFAGKVGSGFTGAMRKELLSKLKPLAVDDSPYDEPPPKDYKGRWGGDLGAVTWVRPELVMRAELGGWTREGVVRQTAYKGLEPGRDPLTVHREVPVATAGAVRAAEAEARRRPTTAVGTGASSARTATMVRRRTTSPNHLAERRQPWPRPREPAAERAPPRPRRRPTSPTTGASPTTNSRPSTRSARKASGTPTASSSS